MRHYVHSTARRSFIILFFCLPWCRSAKIARNHGKRGPKFNMIPRIVGGRPEMDPAVLMWQALFLKKGRVVCGGSVVSHNKILTAAHCDVEELNSDHELRIGGEFVNGGANFPIVNTFRHENYTRGPGNTPVNDLMVVEFHNSAENLGKWAPGRNSDPHFPPENASLKASGYGRLGMDELLPGHLHSVALPVVTNDYCVLSYPFIKREKNICAGNEMFDSCQGDSGGPLWTRSKSNSSQILLIGIVSFGYGCAAPKAPGVYVRISGYYEWIERVLDFPETHYVAPNNAIWKTILSVGAGILAGLILAAIVIFFLCPSRKEQKEKFQSGFNVLIRIYRRKEDMGFVMWNRVAFFTLILTCFGTKGIPIETDLVLSQEIPIEGTNMPKESRLLATTRVDPLVFQKSKCISSASVPIYSSPAVTCPCFLRFVIGSDDPTTWDIFFVPQQSYNSWKEKDYKGDPGNVVEKYSIRKQKTGGKSSFLRTPDVNVFIDGAFVVAIRTNTIEKRCFNSRDENSISSSLVFESMPKACDMPTESTDQRIVGGTPVNVSNAPDLFKWMALIWQSNEQPVCGGAHIAPGYIVTAAHCNVHLGVSSYQIKIGTLQADKGKAFEISRAFTHPKYQQLTTKEAFSDIAILELKDPDAEMSDSVIDWNWKETIPRAGEYVTAAGFGYISEGWNALPDPNRLLRVDVPVVSRPECKNRYENVDGSVHLCAGREEGNCDSCQADSGGPLRYIETLENGSSRQLLVGIVSFGSGCAQSRSPGVYTRVSTYAAWINQTLINARATKKETGFLKNTVAVAGVSTGAVVILIVLVVILAIFIKRRRVSGRAQVVNGDEGSDIPSTSGISQ